MKYVVYQLIKYEGHQYMRYSRLTGFDALLIDRMVYYKFRVNL